MKKFFASIFLIIVSFTVFGQNPFIGDWNGKLSLGGSSLRLVFHIYQEESTLACTLDSPDQGAKGIITQIDIKEDSVFVNLPSIGAKYSGRLNEENIKGTFSQSGLSLPLELISQETPLVRPQTPQPPFPYHEEIVEFSNKQDGALLAGTLLTPNNANNDTPIVIMLTGSGLENRDEEIYDHKPFLIIADYLARNGIASLRYDDRSFGASSGGDILNATTLDFLKDAEAGIAFIKEKNKYGKIGALGHSEGGNIAIMLGANKMVDYVICMAGIGVKGEEAMVAQANKLLEIQGSEEKYTVETYRELTSKQVNPWLSYFLNYNPIIDIKNCSCPTLAINGRKDTQVISDLNLTSIKTNLPQNKLNKIKEYPSLNHLFQNCDRGTPDEYATISETISPEVLFDLAEWINQIQ